MIDRPVLIVLISLVAVIISALVGAWWRTAGEPPREEPADSPSEIDQARAAAARTAPPSTGRSGRTAACPPGCAGSARPRASRDRAPGAPPSGRRTQGDQGHRRLAAARRAPRRQHAAPGSDRIVASARSVLPRTPGGARRPGRQLRAPRRRLRDGRDRDRHDHRGARERHRNRSRDRLLVLRQAPPAAAQADRRPRRLHLRRVRRAVRRDPRGSDRRELARGGRAAARRREPGRRVTPQRQLPAEDASFGLGGVGQLLPHTPLARREPRPPTIVSRVVTCAHSCLLCRLGDRPIRSLTITKREASLLIPKIFPSLAARLITAATVRPT